MLVLSSWHCNCHKVGLPCKCSTVSKTVTSLPVTLSLIGLSSPRLLVQPADQHVFVGESFTLSCHGGSYTTKYLWMKDGQPLTSLSPTLVVEPGGGLVVHNATRCDSGVYTCEVSNEEWSNYASCVVIVTGHLLTCDGERWRGMRVVQEKGMGIVKVC